MSLLKVCYTSVIKIASTFGLLVATDSIYATRTDQHHRAMITSMPLIIVCTVPYSVSTYLEITVCYSVSTYLEISFFPKMIISFVHMERLTRLFKTFREVKVKCCTKDWKEIFWFRLFCSLVLSFVWESG
jgi:hypothetical protein